MKTKQENIILDSQGPFSKIWSTQLKRYFKPIEKKKKKNVHFELYSISFQPLDG